MRLLNRLSILPKYRIVEGPVTQVAGALAASQLFIKAKGVLVLIGPPGGGASV